MLGKALVSLVLLSPVASLRIIKKEVDPQEERIDTYASVDDEGLDCNDNWHAACWKHGGHSTGASNAYPPYPISLITVAPTGDNTCNLPEADGWPPQMPSTKNETCAKAFAANCGWGGGKKTMVGKLTDGNKMFETSSKPIIECGECYCGAESCVKFVNGTEKMHQWDANNWGGLPQGKCGDQVNPPVNPTREFSGFTQEQVAQLNAGLGASVTYDGYRENPGSGLWKASGASEVTPHAACVYFSPNASPTSIPAASVQLKYCA